MIRIMMLIDRPEGVRVEVASLAEGAFHTAVEAELYVFSGEGGIAHLPLWNGRIMRVSRDEVEAICAWEEGNR